MISAAQFRLRGGGRGRYCDLGITRVSQLAGRFTERERLDAVLHRRGLSDLFFALAEQHRAEDQTLTNTANIERLALAFWEPTVELLRRSRSQAAKQSRRGSGKWIGSVYG